MSRRAAKFFSWVQSARFYRVFHQDAVKLLPMGDGRSWLDFGCGPGLLTRLAAQRDYRARGVDRDADMIERARVLAAREGLACGFDVADLFTFEPQGGGADVVSASSLLAAVDDQDRALARLLALTKPGGHLLIVESTCAMTLGAGFSYFCRRGLWVGDFAILLFAFVRGGRSRAGDYLRQHDFREATVTVASLMEGMVEAWVIEPGTSAPAPNGRERTATPGSGPEEIPGRPDRRRRMP